MTLEGIIKFKYICVDKNYNVQDRFFKKINKVRHLLKQLEYIGQYSDGICYGNLSIRRGKSNHFIITASDTGKIEDCTEEHYVEITDCDIPNNLCFYKGKNLPSSETLSHYIIYTHCPEVNAVIHIHDSMLWDFLIDKVPTTSKNIEYGTIEMVNEIVRLLKISSLRQQKVLVMGGHKDGIISFGATIQQAFDMLNASM